MGLSTETEPGGQPELLFDEPHPVGGTGDRKRPLVESWFLITNLANLAQLALPRASSRARDTYLVVGWLPGCFGRTQLLFSPRFAEYRLIVNWSLGLAPWVSLGIAQQELNNAHQHDGGEHPCWELFYLPTYLHYNRLL
jgi:hypothetical protein